MRLWNYKLIQEGLLPKNQMVAQWRELNSIYKKQDDHILINYIYSYPKIYLYAYSQLVIDEMQKRGYKIVKWDNYNEYFKELIADDNLDKEFLSTFTFKEHDEQYLKICLWNLWEKHLRGQKDFTKDVWNKIEEKFGNLIK